MMKNSMRARLTADTNYREICVPYDREYSLAMHAIPLRRVGEVGFMIFRVVIMALNALKCLLAAFKNWNSCKLILLEVLVGFYVHTHLFFDIVDLLL